MKKKSSILNQLTCVTNYFFSAALFFSSVSIPQLAHADTLKIGGTGASLATMQLLAQSFEKTRPADHITVLPSLGSTGGIKALLAGALDIGISSRPLKQEEQAQGGIAVKFATTPFVIATGLKTPATNLTLSQLADIYAGRQTAWPDGTPVRLVLRPANDSDTEILKNMSPELNVAVTTAFSRPGIQIATSDQENADILAKLKGAIGSSTLSIILSEKRPLKSIPLNGATPILKSAGDGRYPYLKDIYIVTNQNTKPLAKEFILFIQSPGAKKILTDNGHFPVK